MKCYNCNLENKDTAKFCKGCNANLTYVPWQPSWRWHLKVLGIIYAVVIVLFFVARFFLNKFDRNLPTWETEYPMYEKQAPSNNAK
jgi:phosphotransferase system  glucose/maltose/N-acetylglucosamine-specific IIC component